MAEVQKPSSALRTQILENPERILADREVMSALLDAEAPAGRKVVDLRGKLVDRLEERLARLEESNRQVIAAAYENLAGTNQVHRAILALLEAADFRTFLTALGDDVCHILSVDAVRLGIETTAVPPGTALGPAGPLSGLVLALPEGGVASYLDLSPGQTARRVTLRRSIEFTEEMFGLAPDAVQSEAILRLDLGPGTRPALLTMGAEDAHRFTPEQAGDLLTFFAGALERMLRRWLA